MKLQLTILFSLFCLFASAQEKKDRQEWKQLFNGKNLDGWDIKIRGYELNNNYGNTFRVEDGKMVVRYDKYDDFAQKYGHIFYKGDFSYYRIAVEYRFVGEQAPKGEGWAWRNSGIMVHGQPAAAMGKDQDFPASIEVQLLGGDGKKRTTCNLCTPGTNVVMDGKLITQHCVTSRSKTYNGDQWVRAEVLVLGDSLVQHFANGEMVLEYNKPQIGGGNVSGHDASLLVNGKLLDHGSISLQSESHPVEFRKVEILDLKGCMDPKASNYKSYFVKADNSQCIYKKK
ncbi:DUF1080 domain-containing protein [Dyadobacter flavalbus]|uniref:DUF1080 domain-containing protein n=1 Tax=Dyadobacter flavalbus TaxID=2579942 RepID=A0A5M8R2M4_9BACT|nr:DUF1080 domain-containing protein [Dyadobacter flavalbus]KAA6440432.1 DUF1080 domain-containing protein [Dyadobacter flavalbus]